jgi:hypothetical protein
VNNLANVTAAFVTFNNIQAQGGAYGGTANFGGGGGTNGGAGGDVGISGGGGGGLGG